MKGKINLLDTKVIINELQRHVSAGNCVAFVGAGMGLYAISGEGFRDPMPLGAELSRDLSENVLKLEYKGQPLSELAEYYELILAGNRNPLVDWLKDQLRDEYRHPGPIHSLMVSLPFKCFVTTNYDTLLTRCLRNNLREPVVSTPKDEDATGPRKKETVYMLHGSIAKPASIIMTDADIDDYFREIKGGVASPHALIKEVVELLRTKPLLFLGFSLRDRHFRDLWSVLRYLTGKSRLTEPAFSLMPDADEHSVRYWQRRGVNIIPFKPDVVLQRLAENLRIESHASVVLQ